MSTLLTISLAVFWLSVLGMVFGNYTISLISKGVFYIAAIVVLTVGIIEMYNKQPPD
jgi:putative Mn2+ efflux pump MntP